MYMAVSAMIRWRWSSCHVRKCCAVMLYRELSRARQHMHRMHVPMADTGRRLAQQTEGICRQPAALAELCCPPEVNVLPSQDGDPTRLRRLRHSADELAAESDPI